MAACSPKDKAVFILHLSLDDAVAEGQVFFGRRDGGSPISRWPKASTGHAQWGENLARTEVFQALAGNDFQGAPEQDEARIGVLGSASGRGFEGQAEAGIEQFLASASALKEANVAGQSGGVRQQHA